VASQPATNGAQIAIGGQSRNATVPSGPSTTHSSSRVVATPVSRARS